MKNILIQLDTDEHPSPFDSIVAHDAGADALLRYGAVRPQAVRALVQGAFFTRGPSDLASMAVWVGGSDVGLGEEVLAEVRSAYFGPFRVSAMLDSNGCNTTAATTIARLAKTVPLEGRRVVIIGLGPVALRSALLLRRQGADVLLTTIPPELFGDRPYRRPRGLDAARRLELSVVEPADRSELERALEGAAIVLAAGPAGVQVLRREAWEAHPTIEVLADYNATEPLGIEGVEATDDLVERAGKRVLGALAIGGPKMKVHKACVSRLFERNDVILDVERVYDVALEMV
jgi:hypothetical protein